MTDDGEFTQVKGRIESILLDSLKSEREMHDRVESLFHAAHVFAQQFVPVATTIVPAVGVRLAERRYIAGTAVDGMVFPRLERIGDMYYAGFTFSADSRFALLVPNAGQYPYLSPTNKFNRSGLVLRSSQSHLTDTVLALFP